MIMFVFIVSPLMVSDVMELCQYFVKKLSNVFTYNPFNINDNSDFQNDWHYITIRHYILLIQQVYLSLITFCVY